MTNIAITLPFVPAPRGGAPVPVTRPVRLVGGITIPAAARSGVLVCRWQAAPDGRGLCCRWEVADPAEFGPSRSRPAPPLAPAGPRSLARWRGFMARRKALARRQAQAAA